MKNYLKITILAITIIFIGSTIYAQVGGGVSVPVPFRRSGANNWIPIINTYEFGSNTNRWSKMWLTDLDVSGVFDLGGEVGAGGIDLNGNPLILDADGDTQIIADTDDTIDFDFPGEDSAYQFTSTDFDAATNNITTTGTGTFGAGTGDDAITVAEGSILRIGSTGALPTTSEIRFGDGDYVRLYEDEDDSLTIDAWRIRFSGSVYIPNDSQKLYFGAGDDVSVYFDGSDMIINSENVTASDELHITNFDRVTTDVFQGAYESSDGSAGATGSFTDNDGNTVTVKDGIITDLGI